MSKHHIICKSKTLDVPIIVTSTISDSNDSNMHENHIEMHRQTDNLNGLANPNKFKLDKGLSLDSHYLNNMSSSSSSSSTNNMTSSQG